MNSEPDNKFSPLLSIIVPVYNTGQYLARCLDSVLSQSYCNIEVIIVDDGSTDNSPGIIRKYQQKDGRIRCIRHKKNIGLFHARLSGIKESKGDYIAHVDSDDYVSVDYYRALINGIIKKSADVAIGNSLEVNDENIFFYNYAKSNLEFDILENDEILNKYFLQEGRNYYWHVIWNKVFTRELWIKALPYLEKQEKHLEMTEDFVFSTVLLSLAKKVVRVNADAYFYCRNENENVSHIGQTFKKIKRSIEYASISFNFVEEFMQSYEIYSKYNSYFLNWKILYKNNYRNVIDTMNCKINEKNILYASLDSLYGNAKEIPFPDYFFSLNTPWDNRYEEIKRAICNPKIKVVSFDIFDTLIVRPFLNPQDLFIMLDDDFRNLAGNKTIADFSTLRTQSEKDARDILLNKNNQFEDITLNEIYQTLCTKYGIPNEIAEKMKQLEIEAELRFCTARQSAFELYEMALHLEKQVICVSDMYLPIETLEKILVKNGYTKINRIYVSSETRTGKWGKMFPLLVSELEINPEEILHIGDNYETDFMKAKEAGLNAAHFIKTRDAFFDPNTSGNLGQVFTRPLPLWQSNADAFNFLGIRIMTSLIANHYFDNPYRSFNRNTDFNADPELIGYGALGMYLFGVTTWLINNFKEKQYDKVLFVARDGILPMEAYKILKPLYKNLPQEEYLYISRQATILLSIQDDLDFYKLHEVVIWQNKTPNDVIPYLSVLFDIEINELRMICRKEKIDLNAEFQDTGHYYSFINICRDNFFNKEKHQDKLNKLRSYFNQKLEGNVCIFDIGYSARPALYLSKYYKKKIDTYFINVHSDAGLKHSQEGGFNLTTFFSYNPAIYGLIDEVFFSKIEGSCTGYNTKTDPAEPLLVKYNPDYPEQFVLETIQSAALQFVHDLACIFKNDIHKLWFQPYYTSLLFSLIFFSSKEADRNLLSCFFFDDGIALQTGNLPDKWIQFFEWKNQHPLDEIYSIGTVPLPEPIQPDLSRRAKFVKLFYWFYFDRGLLKTKIKKRLRKHKLIFVPLKITYKILRKIKRTIKKHKETEQ